MDHGTVNRESRCRDNLLALEGMDFADLLAKKITEAGYNPFSFAKLVGTSQGRVVDIISRRYGGRAPLKDMGAWAAALKLEGKDLDEFLWSGLMSHCPTPDLVDYFKRHHARVDRLEKRVAEYEQKYKP